MFDDIMFQAEIDALLGENKQENPPKEESPIEKRINGLLSEYSKLLVEVAEKQLLCAKSLQNEPTYRAISSLNSFKNSIGEILTHIDGLKKLKLEIKNGNTVFEK